MTCVIGFSFLRNRSGAIGRCFIIDVESVFSKACVLGSFMFACIFKSCMFQKEGHLFGSKVLILSIETLSFLYLYYYCY